MPKSGIVALADGVRYYFEQNNVDAVVARVGLKYRTFLTNQSSGGGSRVVFIPGDFDGSEGGKPLDEGTLGEPLHHVSDNPRELAEWARTVTISVWGVDATQTEDEQAQIEATENLLEVVVRAVHNARATHTTNIDDNGNPIMAVLGALGAVVEWGKVTRTYPPLENSYGCELLVRLALKGPIFDAETPVVKAQPARLTKTLAA